MKAIVLVLTVLFSQNLFAETLFVKCSSARLFRYLEFETADKKTGTVKIEANNPITVQSEDGIIFSSEELGGTLYLSASVYAQVSSRTHAAFVNTKGEISRMACMRAFVR